jgi:hypothetical protein
MTEFDELRGEFDQGFDDDDEYDGFDELGVEEETQRSGFTANERLIVVGMVFLNVLAALFLTWVLLLR